MSFFLEEKHRDLSGSFFLAMIFLAFAILLLLPK